MEWWRHTICRSSTSLLPNCFRLRSFIARSASTRDANVMKASPVDLPSRPRCNWTSGWICETNKTRRFVILHYVDLLWSERITLIVNKTSAQAHREGQAGKILGADKGPVALPCYEERVLKSWTWGLYLRLCPESANGPASANRHFG